MSLLFQFLKKVWHRLQSFKAMATRFGRQQRKTIRATISLIAIIVLFVVCNSVKVVVDGYRVVQVFIQCFKICKKNHLKFFVNSFIVLNTIFWFVFRYLSLRWATVLKKQQSKTRTSKNIWIHKILLPRTQKLTTSLAKR